MAMGFIGRFLWLILSVAAVSVAMVFAASNTHVTTVHLWPFEERLELATWMLVILAACAGALTGGGLVWMSLLGARSRNWRLQRQLDKAEDDLKVTESHLEKDMDDTKEEIATLTDEIAALKKSIEELDKMTEDATYNQLAEDGQREACQDEGGHGHRLSSKTSTRTAIGC